jgi:translation initiation factor eIF-2B subunit beta
MSSQSSLSTPYTVRSWLASYPKAIALLDKFEVELRLGRLSTSSKTQNKGSSTGELSKNFGGIASRDRRQVTVRTVELLRTLIGNTKWQNAAQLMTLLRGIGRELHAAGGAKEPAIANIVRRVMCAVRDEVNTAEANEAQATMGKAKADRDASVDSKTIEPIDENSGSDEALKRSYKDRSALAPKKQPNQGTSLSRNLSLSSMLWAHPQHLNTSGKIGTAGSTSSTGRNKRSDSFSSVDQSSDPLHYLSNENDCDFPPSFYANRPHFRPAVMEAIQEIMLDLEDLHTNIDDQGYAHIHAGEVILTYSRSKTVESFLKATAKKRKFQVIVCEGAPHFGGHRMAKSLAEAGIDTTVIHDSAAFAIMARVNKVLLPAHAVLANGGLIAPSGSHMVALAAAHNSVPLVCLTGMFKLCPMYPHEGQDTLQDLVSPSSVIDYAELSDQVMAKVEFVNPVHDYIPPNLINLYVTNIGAFQPSYIYRLLAEYYHNDDWESFE